eukprot:2599417-Rhodomonas_salina.3
MSECFGDWSDDECTPDPMGCGCAQNALPMKRANVNCMPASCGGECYGWMSDEEGEEECGCQGTPAQPAQPMPKAMKAKVVKEDISLEACETG